MGSLGSEEKKRLFSAQSKAAYANPGYLLFEREGTLFAQPFDAKKLTLTGEPVRIADEVSYNQFFGDAAFAVSESSLLIYRAGGGAAANRQFVWFDRTGKKLGSAGEPGLYTTNFDLSVDGKQIAVARQNPTTSQYDIWLIDLARGLPARFTFDPALSPAGNVVWSPDGLQIAFTSNRKGNRDIFVKSASGIGEDMPLVETSIEEWPEDWSREDRKSTRLNSSHSAKSRMPSSA